MRAEAVSRFDGLRNGIRAYLKSDVMTEFTRDFVSLKRELSAFDSIKFNVANGRCIIQTDHGLEDIVQALTVGIKALRKTYVIGQKIPTML